MNSIKIRVHTLPTPEDSKIPDAPTYNIQCQEWCLTRCIDPGSHIYHVELEVPLRCTGRDCILRRDGYAVSNNIHHSSGKIHGVIYGVRYAHGRTLLPRCMGGLDPIDVPFNSGGIKRYIDRSFVNVGEIVETIHVPAPPVVVDGQLVSPVNLIRDYLDAQTDGVRTFCNARCGGGYNYTGCMALMCMRPITALSGCLNPCRMNRLFCPEWSYRYITPREVPIQVRNNWFCSELSAAALIYGGLIKRNHPAAWYTPQRLVNAFRESGISTGTVAQVRTWSPFAISNELSESDEDTPLAPGPPSETMSA